MWLLKETLQFFFISRIRDRGADTNFTSPQKGKQLLTLEGLLIPSIKNATF